MLGVKDFLHLKFKVAVNLYGVGLRKLYIRLVDCCACKLVNVEYIV
jgi:hypothetical protein